MQYSIDNPSNDPNVKLNWEGFFNSVDRDMGKGDFTVKLREDITGKNFTTRFMLGLYLNDYLALGGFLSDSEKQTIQRLVAQPPNGIDTKKVLDRNDKELWGGL